MKKIIVFIIIVFINCCVIGGNISREEVKKYYNSKGIITDQVNNIVYTLDFTGLNEKIADKDLEYIPYLFEVSAIHLSGCKQITDEGLKYLINLKNLKNLNLDKTNITDSGLKYIKEIKTLQYIDLTSTKVTDKGIQQLSILTELKNLVVYKTKVTKKGVEELQKKLPNCYIDLAGDNY
jgi:hypothetical protein